MPVDFIAKFKPNLRDGIYGDMIENGVFDIKKLQDFVPGYRTRVPLREGLKRSVQWYYDHPDQMQISAENNQLTDDILAAWDAVRYD